MLGPLILAAIGLGMVIAPAINTGTFIALGREDVVLPGDLALRKAIRAAYHLDHLPTRQEVLDIADKWRPYRSLATSYLFSAAFESAEAPPVASPAPSDR